MTRATRASWTSCAVGLVLLAIGAAVDLRVALFSYLVAYVWAASIVVSAVLFLAMAHTTGAGWMAVLRRRAENVASTLPALALLFVPVAAGIRMLFPWAQPPGTWSDELRASIVPKLAYLNPVGFLLRAVVYLASWTVVSELLRRASRKQDASAAPELGEFQRTLAAAALPWMALTVTFAAFDWLMSLDPGWSSNVFGLYLFVGSFAAASGLVALLAFGPLASRVSVATPDHAHALGRLLLTFVILWGYIAFTQYLLVWIADLPSEVPWVMLRTTPGWGTVAVAVCASNFIAPFALLLSRSLKREPVALAAVGSWLVLAHYLDIYWIVMPSVDAAPRPRWVDVGAALFVAGILVLVAQRRARGEAAVPAGDASATRGLRYEASS